ncbi:hypothetical protein N5C66_05850 [Rhizobium pusense]|uniref:hypothetical protein n=1 Tax=Agrobacterium pusense TaxID=648995 RepID=UPI0024477458|nr:hypothetical protein [Agrobacterium pusense]MDH1097420.1 hypothetical protein [Agrobacterium pusense]MDH1111250.1 hypothetical protein [Agrobacterium pusense]MDH2193453.1 hypothetical protein [Agrobacterium pusense]
MRQVLALAIVAAMSSLANAADWPPAMDYLKERSLDCSANAKPSLCEQTKKFWLEDYDKAIRGDYNGQRNIAACLSTGCDGAIVPNPILGCAWHVVVANSGHLEANKLDADWLRIYCGSKYLDDAGRAMADAQARTILKKLGVY